LKRRRAPTGQSVGHGWVVKSVIFFTTFIIIYTLTIYLLRLLNLENVYLYAFLIAFIIIPLSNKLSGLKNNEKVKNN